MNKPIEPIKPEKYFTGKVLRIQVMENLKISNIDNMVSNYLAYLKSNRTESSGVWTLEEIEYDWNYGDGALVYLNFIGGELRWENRRYEYDLKKYYKDVESYPERLEKYAKWKEEKTINDKSKYQKSLATQKSRLEKELVRLNKLINK